MTTRLQEVIETVQAGAVEREITGELPRDAVKTLIDAGFGSLRVSGDGTAPETGLVELFEWIIRVARADSNVAQALRGHHLFTERALLSGDKEQLALIRSGAMIGNSQSERGPSGTLQTTLARADGGYMLNGQKYYATGTLFADYTWTSAMLDGQMQWLLVATDLPGVSIEEDWDGFGQKLTGSGTVRFREVLIDAKSPIPDAHEGQRVRVDTRVFQHLYLQAVLVGIGRAALEDTVAFVRQRTRTYGRPGTSAPAADPLVQTVVGDVAALLSAAEAVLLRAVHELEETREATASITDEDRIGTLYARAQISQFTAQQVVVENVTTLCNRLFEVGGAQALSSGLAMDRHWRNARAVASHNPAILRKRAVGDYLLNDTYPTN